MEKNLIKKAYSSESFREEGHLLIEKIAEILDNANNGNESRTIPWITPAEQLQYWKSDFSNAGNDSLEQLWEHLVSHSINFHSRGYMGHQVSTTPALTALTGAMIAFLNNSTTVYEIGMAGNAMEKVVLSHLAKLFGYDSQSTGVVTSGGSLGNLTALITARTSSGIPESAYNQLAIIVSEEAHYSIERAAQIMGIPSHNVIKIPSDDHHRIMVGELEPAYRKATASGKRVFCVVGCAGTTAVGAYDDLEAIADFAHLHNLWFHVDGAHGAGVIFSQKYKHLLNGIEQSDSLIVDFHKMLMAPAISTAVLYNANNRVINECSPTAAYLWQNQLSEEWYNSAKHTLECTKPITILHTYALLKIYGDALYEQHIDNLYNLGKEFADAVSKREHLSLAVQPESNIICFRYHSGTYNPDKVNAMILQKLLEDGEFYIVSTTIRGHFYLRVSLMNPLTTSSDVERLLDKIEVIAAS